MAPAASACPSTPLPFSPELIAGATTDQAGGFTNFSLLLQRGDGQQRIEQLQFKAPEGLTGMLSTVPLCDEPQADAKATCSAASADRPRDRRVRPRALSARHPPARRPRNPLPIDLDGPVQAAPPFGLSIVTHVIAGPFNLARS